jgi:SAM-dependent methyltransferase
MTGKYDAFARTYDVEYGKFFDDIPFYVNLAKETGGPALEIAIGTGRVAIPIAREGVSVVGVDSSPAMLERLRRKLEAEPGLAVTAIEGDMRDFDARDHGPFALAYCPARGFLHMLTVEDQLRALENVRSHLAEGGRFTGNIFFPSVSILARGEGPSPAWTIENEYVDPDSGRRVIVSMLNRADTRSQRIHVINRVEQLSEAGEVVRTDVREIVLTYLWPRELEHLLARAGFELEALYGDYRGTPFADGGGELVWVARA